MIIRKAATDDLENIISIYASAREFMILNGNPCQWGNVYPPTDLILSTLDKTYLCMQNSRIACVFYFSIENDPTYDVIYNGKWLNDSPYGIVHRVASTHITKGAARFCLSWAFEKCGNLRIDTHRDNIPMQNLLKSLGFEYCGIIHCDHTGDERLAFQKTSHSK